MALSNKKSLVELLLKVPTNREANSLEKVSFRIIQETKSVRHPQVIFKPQWEVLLLK